MVLLESKGGPYRTRVEPGGCQGLGFCRAAECVAMECTASGSCRVMHVQQGPMLCASSNYESLSSQP